MRCAAPLALLVALLATPPCRAALAQQPPAPRDSVPGDTVPSDSTISRRPIHSPMMYLILPIGGALAVAATAIAAIAPAPAARWYGAPGPTEMALLRDHGAAYASVGGIFQRGQTWARSVDVEVVRGGVHGELQAEDFWRPRHVRYLTARGGYLWHPRRRSAGGVTLGYVYADGDPRQRGPELGLPLYIGDSAGTMRLEPTYVLSPAGLRWSYRMQVELYVPGRPYFAGASLVGKELSLASGTDCNFAASAVTLLVGTRF